MRLVLVNHEYPPWGGGAATATEALGQELTALGHRVVIVTAGGGGLPELSGDDRLRIWRIPTGRRSRFAPTATELLSFCLALRTRLSRCLTEVRADGVLAFFAVPAGYFAVRAAHQCGLPAIVSLRGSDVPGFSSSRLTGGTAWAAQKLIRQTLLEADLVAPNCPHLHDLTLRWLPEIRGKLRVVPNGVHPNEFVSGNAEAATEPLRRTCSDPPDSLEPSATWLSALGQGGPADAEASHDVAVQQAHPLRLITVGQLIPRKGFLHALEAVRMVRAAGIEVRLTMVGEGPQAALLKRCVQQWNLTSCVELVGYRSRKEVRQLLANHDLFLMPSRSEGMSNAVLEAMAAGLPVLATQSGCHDLVLEAACGEVTPVDDPAALAAALQRLAQAPALRHQYSLAAATYARQRTWRGAANQFSDLFHVLARQSDLTPADRNTHTREASGTPARRT